MMKNKLLMLTAITASFTYANAATMRENVVKLKGISNAEYNVQDENYFVTDDQPYNKRLEIENTDKGVKITFESGRKKSKKVVTQLEDYLLSQSIPLKGSSRSYYQQTKKPKNLNFAFIGVLSFDKEDKRYRCDNISLGQGHNQVYNNWWFFTNMEKHVVYHKDSDMRRGIQFNCFDEEGAVSSFYAIIGHNNGFIIESKSDMDSEV